MSIHSKVTQWGNVSRFCIDRLADYSELLSIELARARTAFTREVIALVALAVAGLFTLSFFCIALIATAWGTPHFLNVAWSIAGAWFVLSIASYVVLHGQKPTRSFDGLQVEIREDLQTLREALK
ncbi:phage holin family protein [Paraburkholderia sp. LEh10]|uniref:phage holin family protein n=1 Tax=Paraburkholderia sp. LEh10 TaxID=2821353 RepID=UPI001AE3F081|nr:phage holin family protein [Paraburkholderia sp. LEh10]MBP0595405.1 phage holin family protein [Paraburkholderia sp. LEh10]